MVSESQSGILSLLRTTSGFMEERGFSINPRKSYVLIGLEEGERSSAGDRLNRAVPEDRDRSSRDAWGRVQHQVSLQLRRCLGGGKDHSQAVSRGSWLFGGVEIVETTAESGNFLEFHTAEVEVSLALCRTTASLLCWLGVEARRVIRFICTVPATSHPTGSTWVPDKAGLVCPTQ